MVIIRKFSKRTRICEGITCVVFLFFFRVQKYGTEENLTIESQKVIEGGSPKRRSGTFDNESQLTLKTKLRRKGSCSRLGISGSHRRPFLDVTVGEVGVVLVWLVVSGWRRPSNCWRGFEMCAARPWPWNE